jgi:hypothetical protein
MNGLAFMALELAVVALVLVLLNARDRRRDRATAAVLDACPRHLRSAIAVRARTRLLSRRVIVTLEMSDCERADVWAALPPLAGALLPSVALVIGARLHPTRAIAVSVACAASGSR